ncbi:MAG: thioesterase family protein [Verrucomicrobia bacterium]|nr:thioesterase family protein [Verrucomicrobiota bacterium]
MIRTETTIRVRYGETDAMGFAHHANYLSWFELARIEMLDELTLSYKELEKDGYFLPVLGASLSYKQPAYFDDRLTVVCYVREKPGLRIHINYEVLRNETLLCTGSTEHAFISKDGQPVRPPKHVIQTFLDAMENE